MVPCVKVIANVFIATQSFQTFPVIITRLQSFDYRYPVTYVYLLMRRNAYFKQL